MATTPTDGEDRLFLIKLDARRDGRPNTFAVQCVVAADGQTVRVTRVADVDHELSQTEVTSLISSRGLERAIVEAEWERRKPAVLKERRPGTRSA